MNFFQSIESSIYDFVRAPENMKLRAATGSYSTPFRARLFGAQEAVEVERSLATRSVDVLWLGSNPSVKSGLARILAPQEYDDSHFQTFLTQMRSGMFSQHAMDSDASITGFNPLQRPTHKWRLYADAIKANTDIDAVAMANFLPWGSASMEELAVGLSDAEPALWQRMLAFSNELNIQIVEKLKPRLLIVPKSLGDADAGKAPKHLRGLGIVNSEAKELRRTFAQIGASKQHYFTGICRRGTVEVPVIYMNHPDALRVSAEYRQPFSEHFASVMGGLMHRG